MPNYDYHCINCGFVEEISQRMSEASLTKCPNCGKETFERTITGGAGVLYKGEGWYVTDYSKKSSGGKEAESKPASSPAVEKTATALVKKESKQDTTKK
ncbi:MAG: zinc ribbon domain-containing protein [Ignavibacteriota bacterium]